MVEGQTCAVEHETVCGFAVEAVTDDGVAEAFRVSGVDTQLVGASRFGGEAYPCRVISTLDDFPVCDTEFAVDGIEDLPRTVGEIDAEGEFDVP